MQIQDEIKQGESYISAVGPSYLFLQVMCCAHLADHCVLLIPRSVVADAPQGLMSAVLLCSGGGWSVLTE